MVDEPLGDGTSMGRIAIVDDDRTFTDLLVEILGELGYQATPYYQSEGTFALLRHLQPDLILVDVRIEGPQSGWTLLDLLRADEATRAIPLPNLAT
jgi:CheY-like chemotaxis protein